MDSRRIEGRRLRLAARAYGRAVRRLRALALTVAVVGAGAAVAARRSALADAVALAAGGVLLVLWPIEARLIQAGEACRRRQARIARDEAVPLAWTLPGPEGPPWAQVLWRRAGWYPLLIAAVLLLRSAAAGAAEVALPEPVLDPATREAVQAVLEATARAREDQEVRRLAAEVFAGRAAAPFGANAPPREGRPETDGPRAWLFVSRSLGETALREILATASRTGAVVVLRGIPPGQRLVEALAGLRALARGLEPAPRVVLDPVLWRRWHVEVVPTLAWGRHADEAPTAWVRGLTDPDWLRAAVRDGRRGDLGRRGPTTTASEPDLLEVLQARAARYDWAAARRRALARYWERVPMQPLPPARERRVRRLRLAVRLTADLRDAAGRLIAARGTVLDPLAVRPFRLRLLVFDATRAEQVAWAARRRRPGDVLLASRLDRRAGWQGLRRLERAVGAPVYLLTAPVRERFRLRRVPALVRAAEGGRAVEVVEEPVSAVPEDQG